MIVCFVNQRQKNRGLNYPLFVKYSDFAGANMIFPSTNYFEYV